jgi:hypothetical protein
MIPRIAHKLSDWLIAILLAILATYTIASSSHFLRLFCSEELFVSASVAGSLVLANSDDVDPQAVKNFSQDETNHLLDVRFRLKLCKAILFFSLCVRLTSALLTRGIQPVLQRDDLVYFLAFVLSTLMCICFQWNLFFTGFHVIVFGGSGWQFQPDSLLLRCFPENFWRVVSVVFLVLIIPALVCTRILVSGIPCVFEVLKGGREDHS